MVHEAALIKEVLLLCHFFLTWFIVASTFDFVLVAGGYLYAYRKNVGLIRAWGFDASVARMLLSESFPLLLSGAAVFVLDTNNWSRGYYCVRINIR